MGGGFVGVSGLRVSSPLRFAGRFAQGHFRRSDLPTSLADSFSSSSSSSGFVLNLRKKGLFGSVSRKSLYWAQSSKIFTKEKLLLLSSGIWSHRSGSQQHLRPSQFPQVFYTSHADAPSDFYRTMEEYVDLVLWIVGVDRLSQMILVTCVPFVGSFTALVRIFTADCSPYSTYAQWISLVISHGYELSNGLVGNEDSYVSVNGVTTLPCIEVCFKQVLVTHIAQGLVPFISYGVYYLVIARFATLVQSSLACRLVFPALVPISVAIWTFVFSPKVSLIVSGFVAQDSSVLQGFSSRHCLSFTVCVVSLALLAVEDFFLLISRGMMNGVHEVYEISFDIGSLLGSLIICHSQSIFALAFVAICMVFIWACITIVRYALLHFVFSPPSMEFET